MKKLLLSALSVFLFAAAQAQPANDDCTTAQAIGNLPTPSACPTGTGASLNIAGTLNGATPANPYIYMSSCSGTATSMATNVNDVWYTFVATGYQLTINLTGTVVNPNVAMYSGTCGALGGGVGGCTVGTAGGSATLVVNQMVPGTTYYVQISANSPGAGGDFNMSISNAIDCNNCLLGSTLTVNPLPTNGAYAPGTTVNFCFHVSDYTQVNTNWLHGVQLSFGPGWDLSTLSTTPPPACASGTGTWIYYPTGITDAQGNAWPAGFYFDSNLGGPLDGNAGNNFGDNCQGTIPSGSWNFCFTITTAAACNPGASLNVTVNTSGDGESGSWSNNGCVGDAPTIFNAVTSCCPPNMSQVPATCAGNDGQATATPVGTAGPYDWTWTGPSGYSTTQSSLPGASTVTGLVPGTYTVSVIDNNGCLITNTVSVTGGGVNPAPAAANNGPLCVGQTLNLTCNAITGATYNWSGPNGFSALNTQNPSIPSSTTAMSGVYTVTVTVGGCTATATTSVTVNPAPVPTASNGGPYCAGAGISLSSTPAGATTYAWSGPNGYSTPNTQNPSISSATTAMSGVYTVTVAIGSCSATATTSVTVNPLPVVNASYNNPVCLNQAIILYGSGGPSWLWTGPNGFTSSVQTPTISPAAAADAGTYTLTVTDANNCTNTDTANVVVYPLPVVAAANNGPLCPGGTLNLTSTNGMTIYSWTGPSSFNSNLQNPSLAGVTSANAGTYTVTVTDANGCVNAALTTLTINGAITVNAASNSPLCENATLNLSASGAVSYSWTGPNSFNSTQQNPVLASVALADSGAYTVTGTDALGCTGTATVNVVVNPNPVPVASNNGPLCAGANLNLTGSGGPSYSWAGPNNFQSAVQNPPILGVTTAASGTYTLTITNAAGCTASVTTNVTVNPAPVPVINSNSPVCNNGTINLTANGGTGYAWTGPNSFSSNQQNPAITPANQSMSGVYNCTVTGVGACTATASVSVLVYPPVTVTASQDVTVCAGQSISLSAAAGGGNGSYAYLWSPGSTPASTITVTPAVTTTYTVAATSCGEQATDSVTVNVNPVPTLSVTPSITSGCEPLCVLFTGSSSPASADCDWQFSNGVNVNNDCDTTICFPDAGQYGAVLTVTDINGCTNTLNEPNIITVYPIPVADFSSSPQPTDIFDPIINFTDESYNAVIGNWSWSFGDPPGSTSTQQNPSFNYGSSGTYTVQLIVTSVNGCTDTTWNTVIVEENFSLYVPNAFTPNADGINDDFFAKGEGIDLNNWDMWIYDRWGNMIFYTNDFYQHWDGKVQGKSDNLVQIDVYVWKIKCRNFRGEKKSLVGHVTVVR